MATTAFTVQDVQRGLSRWRPSDHAECCSWRERFAAVTVIAPRTPYERVGDLWMEGTGDVGDRAAADATASASTTVLVPMATFRVSACMAGPGS